MAAAGGADQRLPGERHLRPGEQRPREPDEDVRPLRPGAVDGAAGEPITITGLAQVGVSGLAKVQYWLHPADVPLPPDDPHFTRGDWQDADILPPPARWGGGCPVGSCPARRSSSIRRPARRASGLMRYTVVHWAAVLRGVAPGRYELRCRSIDLNGIAQPMPRPFPKSGRAEIQHVSLVVEG